MKLSLAMIVKNELRNLQRLKPLVENYIDEWVVVLPPDDPAIEWCRINELKVIVKDFTQTIEPEYRDKIKEYGLEVDEDYRLFNFAAARNESLQAATGDYVLWLDADDEPIGMSNIKKYLSDHNNVDVFYAVYDYYKDEEGNAISDHMRERVFKNNNKLTWKAGKLGLIHETLLPIEDVDNPTSDDFPDTVFRVEHHTDHVLESSMRNHLALLYEYIKTDGEDPRTIYYLGIEYFNRRMYEFCIKIMQEYVKNSGSQEEIFYAYLKMGEAYHMMLDEQSGRNAYLTALDLMPQYPHAYLALGESYFDNEMYAKAIEFTLTGLQKKVPKTKHVVDMIKFTFRPAMYMALAYLELGKPQLAYEWFIKAAKINPKHPMVKQYVDLFRDAKDLNDYVKSFVKLGQLSQRLYPKTLPKLAEVIPDNLMDQELLMDFKWRYSKPAIWSDNSIVFFCSSAFEDWGPESLEKGCGGSEEAVIHVSRELVKLGYEVTIYNNCIKEGVVDGVKWIRYERFNPRDMFNIIVSWRNNLFATYEITALKKYIDMHDVTEKTFYTKKAVGDAKLLFKSHYHAGLYPLIPKAQKVVIPNGISLAQFESNDKVANNLVWTSSYDRGLEYLLEMWPEVKAKVKDATLDVYYGFQLYDSTPWGKKPKGQIWKHKMQELLSQDGVTDHGRVGNKEIAAAYNKADIFAYPTGFPEIDCISLTKATAAKCIPITTDYAALKERNLNGIMIRGSGHDEEVRKLFKRHLIETMKTPSRKEFIRKKLDVSEYDWTNIAKQWDEEFTS